MKFYMLDGNEKILCAVPSKDIISLYQNLNYHQADTIEGSLVLSEKYTSILNNVRYFAISDRESNHNFYLYRKTLVQVQNHEIAINGQGAFWDEMQGAYIKDKRPNQVTPADTIKLILSYSRWNVDYVDQMLEEESLRRDMNFYYVSLLDALNTVYQTWQVDIEPYINIEGHQITRRYVKLYQQQGGNNGRRFVYGDNALTVTQQANEGSIFTALVGRGAGVEETDASGNLTGGYSRKISFADVEWSKANGDPCDKPKGQEYVEWKESTELYGYSDGKPRIGIVNFDNEKDPAQLLKETWAQLQQVGVPLVQFQATVGDVGYLNLGETVTIVRYDLDIKYQTRVTGIKWNRCDEAKSQITIGVKAIQSTADKIAGLQQSVAQANVNADEAKSTANHAIIDGTGAVVNYGPNEPTNPKEGDIWYDVQPDGTVVLKQYQNGQWVILIDDTTGQQIKNKVEAQQKELDKAVQDANAASAKADGLVAQVGDANTNAQKALTTAQQNQADLAQAKNDLENTKNQLTNVQSDLTGTKSSLAGAISNISQAQEDLKNTEQGLQGVKSDLANTKQSLANDEKNLTNLSEQAKVQGQSIVNIHNTQAGLAADIADVKGNVSSLQDTADGLQATVGTLNSDNLLYNSDFMANTPGKAPNTDWLPAPGWLSLNNTAVERCMWYGYSALQVGWINANAGMYTKAVKSNTPDPKNANATTAYDLSFLIMSNAGTYDVYIEASYTEDFSNPKQIKLGTINQLQGWAPQEYSFTVPSVYPWLRLKMVSEQDKGLFYLAQPMLVYGSKKPNSYISSNQPSQKIASISETVDGIKATVSDNTNGISQIKQTVQGIQSDVANNKNDISSIKQTADSLKSSIQDDEKNISSLQQTATSLQSAVENNKNDISVVKQTAEGVESTVTNMKISSANLLPNTFDFLNWESGGQGAIEPASQWNTQTDAFHGWIDTAKAWIRVPESMAVYLEQGKQYTYSAKVWNNGAKTGNDYDNSTVQMYINSPSNSYGYTLTEKVNHTPRTYAVTFTAPETGKYTGFNTYQEGNFVGGSLWTAECMLVEGNVVTAYQPSSQDMAKNADVSTIKQDITGLEATVKSNSGNISDLKLASDKLQSTVQSNTGQISKVKQTADSLQSTVTNNSNNISSLEQTANSIQSTVANMKIGGTNLLPETESYTGYIKWGNVEYLPTYSCDDYSFTPQTKIIHLWTNDNNPIDNASPTPGNRPVNLIQGNTYTFSAYVWHYGESSKTNELVTLYANKGDDSFAFELGTVTTTLTGVATKYKVTFTAPQTGEYTRFRVVHKNSSAMTNGSMYIAEMKLEDGNIATDWSPSPYDLASQTDMSSVQQKVDNITSTVQSQGGDISQLKQTSDSLTSQIGNANNDISSLKQRADSMESNISDNKNDISDLWQTANSLQSNIQSKADISQITQLSNTFQTVVQTIGAIFPNGNFNDSNIQTYWLPWDVTTDYTNITYDSHHPDGFTGSLCLHDTAGGTTKAITKEYIPVVPGQDVTLSVWSAVGWSGNSPDSKIYIHFYDKDKNEVSSANTELQHDSSMNWYHNTWTWGTFNNNYYARIEVYTHSDVEARTYVTGFDIQSGNGATLSSKISQLSNDINLKVQKGDLISQINIEAGKMLIQSKNLFLDASTVTFSGKAFIPSAAITDLSADKITAGTLNAGNVNIINLDVNKLVGNTTEFVRSGWTNAYGSHVQIDGDGMTVNYGNWYTRFDGNGMTFKDGGESLGGFTRVGMAGAPDWYNGLAFNAGGDAEFLSIGAQDYGNDNQNPVPAKLLWMRSFDDKNRYGYQPGWNFCDTVWANQVGMSSIQYGDWNIHFETASGDNGFTALELLSGIGNGFYWGSDGSFGYVTNHNSLHNVNGSQIVTSINQNSGTCESWHTVQ